MNIHKFTFNPFQENTYVLSDDSNECIVVDPGCFDSDEEQEIKDFILNKGYTLKKVVNTHGHVDHMMGNAFFFNEFGLKPIIHQEDVKILENQTQYGEMFGVRVIPSPEPQELIEEGDQVKFGNTTLDVVHVPGHSPGHVVLINHSEKEIIGGDVLFLQSIGRTDLPFGDHNTLIENIKTKLFTLDDDYRVHPGHGPSTNIGFEKENNPFF